MELNCTKNLREKMESEQRQMTEIVYEILEEDERARNQDTWLVIRVLQKLGYKVFIPYNLIGEMPSFESITRSRRKVQNEFREFLPTNPEVMRKRRIKQTAIQNWVVGQ